MRLRVMIAGMIVVSVLSTAAISAEPLPAYPKGQVMFELNLTEKDFLPAIKELLPMIPGIVASGAPMPVPDAAKGQGMPEAEAYAEMVAQVGEEFTKELQSAISGLQQVTIIAYALPDGAKSDEIGEFYMQKLGLTKSWQRSFRMDNPNGTGFVRLYTKPDLTGMFMLVRDNQKVFAVKTEGRIDVSGIGRLAGKYLPMIMSRHETAAPEQPAETTTETPAPEAPPSGEVEPCPASETSAPPTTE